MSRVGSIEEAGDEQEDKPVVDVILGRTVDRERASSATPPPHLPSKCRVMRGMGMTSPKRHH